MYETINVDIVTLGSSEMASLFSTFFFMINDVIDDSIKGMRNIIDNEQPEQSILPLQIDTAYNCDTGLRLIAIF